MLSPRKMNHTSSHTAGNEKSFGSRSAMYYPCFPTLMFMIFLFDIGFKLHCICNNAFQNKIDQCVNEMK